MRVVTDEVVDKFLSKVKITPYGCWNYELAPSYTYGAFWFDGKTWHAHRFSIFALGGVPREVVEQSHVHHTCENKQCVNPVHLQALRPNYHRRITMEEYQHRRNKLIPLNLLYLSILQTN